MPAEKDLRPRAGQDSGLRAIAGLFENLEESVQIGKGEGITGLRRLKVIHQIPPSSRRSTAGLLRSPSAIDTLSSVVGGPAGHGKFNAAIPR
jgi:hypothetical protein